MLSSFGLPELVAITTDRLLRSLLLKTPVCDVALERLLTRARLSMLDLATARADVPGEVLDFCCALAQQCFINEYVFACASEESDRARSLREQLASALAANDIVPPLTVATVAAYFPLHTLDVPPDKFERPWPEPIACLIVQQVREPGEEQSLRASIPALTPITDNVSAQVRQQYEENPYPRWVATSSLHLPISFDERIRSQFPRATFMPLAKPTPDILIAGCGTGRHAVETAQQHPSARILAIDLSLASLAYATRKARELRVANVTFDQADILQLGSLRRAFDVIESVGVLHHLRDPLEGWRILLSLLRPGGFMRVGLYSSPARQHISAARTFIAERGYRGTADGVRQLRQDILNLEDGSQLKAVTDSSDFFTVSRCRDLLFHVEEHLTGIPEIKSFLAANHLTFLGFDDPAESSYADLFPADKSKTDLDCWHLFETSHPATFARMYQFWLQKPYSAIR
jgi:SAM-dependent methyltransferase